MSWYWYINCNKCMTFFNTNGHWYWNKRIRGKQYSCFCNLNFWIIWFLCTEVCDFMGKQFGVDIFDTVGKPGKVSVFFILSLQQRAWETGECASVNSARGPNWPCGDRSRGNPQIPVYNYLGISQIPFTRQCASRGVIHHFFWSFLTGGIKLATPVLSL